jgi:hypothetical protein
LDNGRDRPPVNLKIEPHIPSEVCRPENEQMSTWLRTPMPSPSGDSGSNENRADETKNQEEPASRVVF